MNKKLPIAITATVAALSGMILADKEGKPAEANQAGNSIAKVDANFKSAKTDTSRAKGVARPWAQSKSDIKADPKSLYGTLENGMRYIIHKNGLPANRASLRLHIDAGSLSEKESQRGVAHFLEHMVFNGTKSFPDATKLVPQMQRLGIAFGAHANAYTAFDETVYMLDLPDNKKSTMDLAYNVMGDFADGALLTNAEIDEERGVISSEKTSRDSIGMRMMEKQFSYLLPNSILTKRFPIGTDEVIAKAPRSEFVDFYTRYYTPEKMTFVIVGDIDVAATEQRIHQVFGKIKNPAKKSPKGSVGDLTGLKGFNTAVFADKEVSQTSVGLVSIRPYKNEIDSVAKRAKRLPISIANAIINRRLSRLARKENSAIVSGSTNVSPLFNQLTLGNFDVTAAGDNWQAAVPVLENELRRAVEHGFTQNEFNEVKAQLLNMYQQSLETAPSLKSPAIASSLIQHIHGDIVFSTAETDLEIYLKNIAKVTPETCHAALKEFWDTEDITLVLNTSKKPENAEKTLLSIFKRAQLDKVAPPVDRKTQKFAYTDFGPAGKIVKSNHIKDLDIHQIQFENGIKVNYKQTDFYKNEILLSAKFGNGKFSQPKKAGIDMLAGAVVNGGGLGKHSADDLRSLLAGKNVGVSFGISDQSFNLGGKTTPKDLKLQLQLMSATLMDTGYRPEAERQFKAAIPSMFKSLKHSARGAQAEMQSWLKGGDHRFTVPKLEQIMALNTEDIKAWIDPHLKNSALEIGIVGDIDPEELLPLLSKTIGALPKRAEAVKIDDALRNINVPKSPVEKTFTFDSKIPTAMSILYWKTGDNLANDIKLQRRMSILGTLFSDRMRIKLREELGEAYSPSAYSSVSTTYKNVGGVIAVSPVKIKDQDNVNQVLIDLGAKFAKEGATQDELDRALNPKLGMMKKNLRQNAYWLGSVVGESQTKPYLLDWARTRDADYRSIKLEEINALAKKMIKENTLSIKILPKAEGK